MSLRTWTPLGTAFSSTIVTVPLPAESTELDCTTAVWPPSEPSNPGAFAIESTSPPAGARFGVPLLTSMNSAGYLAA